MGEVRRGTDRGALGKLTTVAQVLYRAAPDAAAITGFGLTLDDFEADYTAEVWPDNEQSIDVFVAMSTQWAHGFAGPTGLKYEALAEIWKRLRIPVKRRDAIFEDLRVMELAALKEMRKD